MMTLQLFHWLDSGVRQVRFVGRNCKSVSELCNILKRRSRSEYSVPGYQLKQIRTLLTISIFQESQSRVGLFSLASKFHRFTLRYRMHTAGCQAYRIRGKWNYKNYSKGRKMQDEIDNDAVPENIFVRSVVSILKKTDKWDALLDELCVACNSKITPPIAVQVIKRIKKPAIALKFFEWLEDLNGFDHDSLTYSAILSVLARDYNPFNLSTYDSLLHKKIQLGFDVTPADYDFVLYRWACTRELDKSLSLLNEMVFRGFNPSVTSCSILLEELLESKEEESGWLLFQHLLDRRVDALDTEIFNVVMKVLCKKGRLDEAFELFSRMKQEDCVPDLDTFNILIKGCCEKSDAQMVFHLFKHMLEIKVKPDSYSVSLLIKELCKQGRPDYGNSLFNHMRRVGWLDRKFVYAQLVESLCHYGWWLKALKIFIKMVQRGHHPRINNYSTLMRHIIMASRLSEAFKLKEFMLKKAFLPEISVYNGLIDGLCSTGRMDMVDKLIVELSDKQIKVNRETCNLVLCGHCLSRNLTAALYWIDKIKGEGWDPDIESCKLLLNHLSSEGKVGEVLELKSRIGVKDSESAKNLVRQMLEPDPKLRLTAKQVLEHSWLQNARKAPNVPLGDVVKSRLKQFSRMNRFKRRALRVIAEHLSIEEVEDIKGMFRLMDTDNDGIVSHDELKAGLGKFGSHLVESEVQMLIEAVDTKGKGTLDYGEFLAVSLHLQRMAYDEHLRRAFSYFDKDGNDFIEPEELREALAEDGAPDSMDVANDILQEVDTDKDGRISYDEFVAMMKAGTDWRKASRHYSRGRFNSLSVRLMKDGSLNLG